MFKIVNEVYYYMSIEVSKEVYYKLLDDFIISIVML